MHLVPPSWLRSPALVDGDGSFAAGGALALLSLALAAGGAHQGVWRARLALAAAAATAGRGEDEAALRDARHLTPPGHDPGPAGRTYALWRHLRPLGDAADGLAQAGRLLGLPAMPADAPIAAELEALAGQPPLRAAAAAAGIAQRHRPDLPALAPWLADAVLAARLRWPVALPLLAVGLGRRRPRTADAAWPAACAAAYARAALRACDLFAELDAAAARLAAVERKLRAKGAGAVVAALLAEDSLMPAHLPGGLGDRAGRRLFARLAGLGVVRELSGRGSFRVFGL